MKIRTVVSFMGVKIKHFWNIRTFGNVDATQLRRWGALGDLSHPLGSPRCSSSREGVRMRNPCYSRQAQFKRSWKSEDLPAPSPHELLSFPIIARVLVRRSPWRQSKRIMLADQQKYLLGFSMKWFQYSRCLLEQCNTDFFLGGRFVF